MADEQNTQNNDATTATGTTGVNENTSSNQSTSSSQGTAAATARGIISQVKESGGKVAGEALDQVKEKASTKIEEQKSNLAHGLGNVAETIRQVGDNLRDNAGENTVTTTAAGYGDSLAGQVEQFSKYLDKHNISDMLRDVEKFARRNPAYFIGGAFLLGLLGARFLKSSKAKRASAQSDNSDQEVFHHHTEKNVDGSGEGIRLE